MNCRTQKFYTYLTPLEVAALFPSIGDSYSIVHNFLHKTIFSASSRPSRALCLSSCLTYPTFRASGEAGKD